MDGHAPACDGPTSRSVGLLGEILSSVTGLYAGSLCSLEPEGQRTGIIKQPVEIADVTKDGIIGDHQADRRFHGGPEKALHQFALQSYEVIASEFPELRGVAVPGSIGENISSSYLTDATVCIGDIYRIGGILTQISQPRNPCWKIDRKFGVEKLSIFVEKLHVTGWYYRVLETGRVYVGDKIRLVERPNESMSVGRFMGITKQHRPDLETFEIAMTCKGLNPELAARLKARRRYLGTAI